MPKSSPLASTAALLAMFAGTGCATDRGSWPPLNTDFLSASARTHNFSAGAPASISLTPDGSHVLFLRSGPQDVVRSLYQLDTATGETQLLLSAEDLLKGSEEELSAEELARRERQRQSARGIASYRLSRDGNKVLTSLSGQLYIVDRLSGAVRRLPESEAGAPTDFRFSHDGRYVSCIRDDDIFVIDLATNTERAITTDGTRDLTNGVAEFVAQEEMGRSTGYWWSPDSQYIIYQQADLGDVEPLYIADARHPERRPARHRYPRAGTPNARVRLGVVALDGGETQWLDWDREQFPYLATVRSEPQGPATMLVQRRDQREQVLYRIDSAELVEILRESDDAWLNLEPAFPIWLDGGNEFLWMTERTGEWTLELRTRDGALVHTYQPQNARMSGVVAVDRARREVVMAVHRTSADTQLDRVSIDTAEVAAITSQPGVHRGEFSENGDVWVHTASLATGDSVREVLRRDGTRIAELPSVAEEPPFTPNTEWTAVEIDGRLHLAVIIRPRNFQQGRSYPLINYVYGGPGANTVTTARRQYLRQQWIADQGFIVVSADARGTPRRGREWERITRGNLIAAPLDDQAAIVQALCRKYREMDGGRVGIYGWSFGGYFAAMAVLKRPDVFHAAVAGAPVIDWRDYDTHYTERFMGLPQENQAGYDAASALTYAADLSRPLLLVHGMVDDNVYFTHTLKMYEALFLAGRSCDLLPLPGFTHRVARPETVIRQYERIVKFFQQNL